MNAFDQEFYWYWFVNIKNIGNRSRVMLMERYGHPEKIYQCRAEELEGLLTKRQIHSLESSRDFKEIEEGLKKLREENIRFIHWESEDYPERFRGLYDPPYAFYLRGCLPADHHPSVAIVGSRHPSPYGKKMAMEFSAELASRGVSIISGMAAGIDAEAHRAALDCSGSTLGILGGGIDSMYPKVNCNLYLDMYENAGILSEYNIGVANKSGLFPMRNRLISGLADAVLVVEAGEKSGSLITADQGMEQGKEIYAVPGRITDPMSIGCNHLIAQGAIIAESPLDMFKDLQDLCHNRGLPHDECIEEDFKRQKDDIKECILTEKEAHILNFIDISQPVSFEKLLEETGLAWQELQHILVEMELKLWIYQPQQNLYLKKIF